MISQTTPNRENDAPRVVRSVDKTATHVLMMVNRKAGAGRRRAIVQRVVDRLHGLGISTTVLNDLVELADLSHAATEAGDLRAVISAGGDGTISAVLNSTPVGTPLAVLPMGTENLLARYLHHRPTPESIVELLTGGLVLPMDAALAGDQLFAIVFSAGLDAEVVRRVHEQRNGNITHLAYAGPLMQAVGGYDFPQVTASYVDHEGERHSTTGCWTFAANLPCYALGLPLLPNANGSDGLLDLCQLQRGTRTAGLWYLWHVLRRRHHTLESVSTARSAKFRIESADGHEVPFQVDGDPGGVLPVEISSLPGRMQLLVTPAVAARLGFAAND